ncbi:glycosyltransferase [Chrysiogenes arsenatis]|uniref:glycosyltransferase n=1 Tax=Chrysiogenes arsenatis TaxID=309797 RepID=UPI0003FF78FC|nr:glycosyltransferase [Chrysiogenes arsenatis]
MKFSVLLSIYHKEAPDFFNRAMRSIWDEQSVKPNEIVLVQDGPLTQDLYDAINTWKEKLGGVLKCVPLQENVGLGDALNIGIKNCSFDLIARMDTDDISMPDRFQKQLEVFEKMDIDVCSSWVSEFSTNELAVDSVRKVPELHSDIVVFAKSRCPLNHPAVMYRKSIIEQAGSYKKMMWFEDYYLWARCIMIDAKLYNIQEPLVHMRAGLGQLERRSGLEYAIAELIFLWELRNMGYLSNILFLRGAILRFVSRILPKVLVRKIYNILRD